jgi:hypothetical protein
MGVDRQPIQPRLSLLPTALPVSYLRPIFTQASRAPMCFGFLLYFGLM